MITRRFGNTSEHLSVLGFGTAPIGLNGYQDSSFVQSVSEAESVRALDAAIANGVTFFDTAPAYANKVPTNGWSTDRASERMLGTVLARSRRDKLFIATKNMFDRMSAAGIRESMEESLRLLQTDYVDLFQVHGIIAKPFRGDNWREFVTDEVLETFLSLKKEGKCRYIGISGYREGGLCAAMASGHFDAVMPQFNFFYRGAEWELVKMATASGIAVLPMRPLTGKLLPQLLKKLDPQARLGVDPYRIAMEYILSFASVTSIPVGMRTAREVEENVRLVEELQGARGDAA